MCQIYFHQDDDHDDKPDQNAIQLHFLFIRNTTMQPLTVGLLFYVGGK